jgi:hypothetical protein
VSVPAPGAHPSSPASVPINELPVLVQIEQLTSQARSGDAYAACRLGASITDCARHARGPRPGKPVDVASNIAEQSVVAREYLINAAASAAEEWERREARCSGIAPQGLLLQAMQYLLSAAQNGSSEARARFVDFPIAMTDILQQPELGRLYMANAPLLYMRMLETGDTRAIDLLGSAGLGLPEQNRAPLWHAIPDSLRSIGMLMELRRLRFERVLYVGVSATDRPPTIESGPPVNTEIAEQAQSIWDRYFEHSAAVRQQREQIRSYQTSAPQGGPALPPEVDSCE